LNTQGFRRVDAAIADLAPSLSASTLLFIVWFNQYKFFRRYGLQDNITMVAQWSPAVRRSLYVYPLKFVFTLMLNMFAGGEGQLRLLTAPLKEWLELLTR